jgi:hypothetical protein
MMLDEIDIRRASFLMPIAEGKEEEARAFYREFAERHREMDELGRDLRIYAERIWIAKDPYGRSYVIVYLECADPERIGPDYDAIDDEFANWGKAGVSSFSGLDMTDAASSFVPAEPVYEWVRGAR